MGRKHKAQLKMKNIAVLGWMAYFTQARELKDEGREPKKPDDTSMLFIEPREPNLAKTFPKDWTRSTCIEGADAASDEQCELSQPVDRDIREVSQYRKEMMYQYYRCLKNPDCKPIRAYCKM